MRSCWRRYETDRAGRHSPSHIDTHKHTHLLPPVFDALARVAQEFRIPWVRRPFDFGIDSRAQALKAAVAFGMRVLRPGFSKALEGLRSTDYFTGFQLTGTLDQARLRETSGTFAPRPDRVHVSPWPFGAGVADRADTA